MVDPLATLNKIRDEHLNIRRHLKLAGDSVGDVEATSSLQRARAEWVPGRTGISDETKEKLNKAITGLAEGLKNHFAFEERTFPALLGENFVHAILLDHAEIMKILEEGEAVVAGAEVEDGCSREELIARETQLHQVISNICHLIEEHASREEVILDMLKRALEDKNKTGRD